MLESFPAESSAAAVFCRLSRCAAVKQQRAVERPFFPGDSKKPKKLLAGPLSPIHRTLYNNP